MQFILLAPTVMNHDAVGNDIEAMYHLFSEYYSCRVYTENQVNKCVKYIEESELDLYYEDVKVIWILHHSIYWRQGEKILSKVKGKIVFKYHNITPDSFFKSYYKLYAELCSNGREQTIHYMKCFPDALWISDSLFNSMELINVEKNNKAICPPFHKIESNLGKNEDKKTSEQIRNSKGVQLLFVGRIAPNKGHLFLLDIVKNYKINFSNEIKLRIIGKFDSNIETYNQEIKDRICEYGLSNNVEFIGEVTDETLRSYYKSSDFFICGSDHEGFCVPIIEAQFFKLPILTISSTAIDETIGVNQVILDKNVRQFSLALRILYENKHLREKLITEGYLNYVSRYSHDVIKIRLIEIIKEKLNLDFNTSTISGKIYE